MTSLFAFTFTLDLAGWESLLTLENLQYVAAAIYGLLSYPLNYKLTRRNLREAAPSIRRERKELDGGLVWCFPSLLSVAVVFSPVTFVVGLDRLGLFLVR